MPIIHRHGGAIDKFLGDGIMATFGAVDHRPDFAAAALRRSTTSSPTPTAGRRDRTRSAAARGRRQRRGGAGEVIFGTIGNEQRLEYTVIGAAVNLAAKLEKCNRRARARALTDAATFRLAQAQGYLARPRPRRLRFAVSGARQAVVLHEAAPNKR